MKFEVLDLVVEVLVVFQSASFGWGVLWPWRFLERCGDGNLLIDGSLELRTGRCFNITSFRCPCQDFDDELTEEKYSSP